MFLDHFVDDIENAGVVNVLKLFKGDLGIKLKEFEFSFLKVSFQKPFEGFKIELVLKFFQQEFFNFLMNLDQFASQDKLFSHVFLQF